MKYRNHSLRYEKRPSLAKPERALNNQSVTPEPEEAHIISTNTDEPLINVHDAPSRFDEFKENIGAISHLIVASVVPKIKHLTSKLFSRVRPLAIAAAKKIYVSIRTFRLTKSSAKKVLIIALICIVGFLIMQRFLPKQKSPTALTIDEKIAQNGPVGGTTPNYQTLLPRGKTIEQLGGWTRVSPPDRNPVFAYVDTVSRVQVTVSQQPLPEDFSTDPDQEVKDLAHDFNAKERVVADDATIYFVGTSTKGPQSVILAKGRTLVLIKSPVQIKNDIWSAYIATLK